MRFSYIVVILLLVLVTFPSGDAWRRRRRRRRRTPPRDCRLSSWSRWSTCNHQCGNNGVRTRTRSKLLGECCGGRCWPLKETSPCNRNNCHNGGTPIYGRCRCRSGYTGTCCHIATPRNCVLSSWSRWSACSHRCGNAGIKYRRRFKIRSECCGGICWSLWQISSCNRKSCAYGIYG